MACYRIGRQLPASRRGPSERLGTDAVQKAEAAGSVVECLDVIEDISTGEVLRLVDAFADALLFRLLKNDSATALSQQLARLLMLGSRLWAWQKRLKSSLPYWLPWTPFCLSSGYSGLINLPVPLGDDTEHLAPDGALEGSDCIELGVPFGDTPGDIGLCRRIGPSDGMMCSALFAARSPPLDVDEERTYKSEASSAPDADWVRGCNAKRGLLG